jgi:hypothetical protein
MKKKILMAMFATMMTMGLMSTGLTAYAAELPAADAQAQVVKQQLNAQVIAQVFDAKYYAEKNPDVVAVVGTDATVLMNHYMSNGVYEGRDASATFNVDAYASANADVATVAAGNYEVLFEHYVGSGINENRISTIDAATKAGITVTSVANPDVVIAKPTKAAGYTPSANDATGGLTPDEINATRANEWSDMQASEAEFRASAWDWFTENGETFLDNGNGTFCW